VITAARALEHMRSFPILPFKEAFPDGPVAVLAPHPDDESLGCGGSIAELCDQGCPPFVIVLTDGTGSHPNSRLYPAERLRLLREQETRTATLCLGVPPERLVFLRYRDTAAPVDGAELQEAASRLASILDASGCRILLAPWRHDPHCDHQAAAAIAECAGRIAKLRVISYPVWGLTLPPGTMLPETALTGFQVKIARQRERKRAAIHAHATQYAGIIPDDPEGFQMPPDFIDLFLQDREIFLTPRGMNGVPS
jgi:LmbE family N-acetylglucosaminyl deacetylase